MDIEKINNPVQRLFAFAQERQKIYLRWRDKKPKPWTKDPVLANYRFCNIYREQDVVTVWIKTFWRDPHKDDPDLWFAMCVARLFNNPITLANIHYPVPFEKINMTYALRDQARAGQKIFNAAYIVSTNGISVSKVPYILGNVLEPLWKNRLTLRPLASDTLQSYHLRLGAMQGFGSFMTAQVIADLKYVQPLAGAKDWFSFASSGPGSRRGLNYILGRDKNSNWTEDAWRLALGRLREELIPMIEHAGMPAMHAQDTQNLLCEYSKWHRATFEGQMPKQKYGVSK